MIAKLQVLGVTSLLGILSSPIGLGAIQVVSERIENDSATAAFAFKDVPAPVKLDAAEKAVFSLVDGQRDINGGELVKLNNGRLPQEEDQPAENFFFRAGSAGGRLVADLGDTLTLRQINTYSWHPGSRGPQVYRLYASDGQSAGFKAHPKRGTDPEACGWKLLAAVDTRPKGDPVGGQHGVSIRDTQDSLGRFRYLLFDVARTSADDPFGQTFLGEIDVIAQDSAAVPIQSVNQPITRTFEADGGRYHFTLDTTLAPDLTEWADLKLRPVVQEWYPQIVALLPSDGFTARTNVTLRFRDDMGGTPASAGGRFVNCNAGWFRRELNREALGSVVHELVHVVQSYGGGRRNPPNGTRMPGWLVEGIPDYIRWFLYEPQTKGAEITAGNLDRARYDASYRISANFLNWVTLQHGTNLVPMLNAAGRAGTYRDDLWQELTGKTVGELGIEWKRYHADRLGVPVTTKPDTDGQQGQPK